MDLTQSKSKVAWAAIVDWATTTKAMHIDGPFFARDFGEEGIVLFEIKPWYEGISLGFIKTPPEYRRKGLATRALKELQTFADKHGVPITGGVKEMGDEGETMNDRQLKKWYKGHGFKTRRGSDIVYSPAAKIIETIVDILLDSDDIDPGEIVKGGAEVKRQKAIAAWNDTASNTYHDDRWRAVFEVLGCVNRLNGLMYYLVSCSNAATKKWQPGNNREFIHAWTLLQEELRDANMALDDIQTIYKIIFENTLAKPLWITSQERGVGESEEIDPEEIVQGASDTKRNRAIQAWEKAEPHGPHGDHEPRWREALLAMGSTRNTTRISRLIAVTCKRLEHSLDGHHSSAYAGANPPGDEWPELTTVWSEIKRELQRIHTLEEDIETVRLLLIKEVHLMLVGQEFFKQESLEPPADDDEDLLRDVSQAAFDPVTAMMQALKAGYAFKRKITPNNKYGYVLELEAQAVSKSTLDDSKRSRMVSIRWEPSDPNAYLAQNRGGGWFFVRPQSFDGLEKALRELVGCVARYSYTSEIRQAYTGCLAYAYTKRNTRNDYTRRGMHAYDR